MMTMESVDCSMERLIPYNEPLNRDSLLEMAEREFSETQESRDDCLQQLKELIRKHDVCCCTTDEFLLRFLRSRKFRVQRSFEALKNYAKTRTKLDHQFTNLPPEALEEVLQKNVFGILPYRDSEGGLIYFIKPGNLKNCSCTEEEAVISTLVLFSFAAEDETVQINGIRFIIDEDNHSLETAMIVIRHMRLLKDFVFNSFPARYRCIHVINEPWHYRWFLSIMKFLLPAKLRSRILLHGKDRSSLFEHIPSRVFPKESENGVEYSNDHLIGIMSNYLQKFKEEQFIYLDKNNL